MLPFWPLLIISFVCLLVGLGALLWAHRRRQLLGLPSGDIRYSDTGGEAPEALFSSRYGLAGRPDYLTRERGQLIPVEVKSGVAPATPYDSHVLQLAAYCLLVEDLHRSRPPFGVIQYADASFRVEYTDELKDDVLTAIDEMRDALNNKREPATTPDARRCRRCGYREDCELD
jgi:CRISPR-associated exonuclease Cas4